MTKAEPRPSSPMASSAADVPLRVLVVFSHPVQYHSPVFAAVSRDGRVDLTVAYCSLVGVKAAFDPDFAQAVAWDVPLLEGYRWQVVPNVSPRPGIHSFLGLINPGLASLIWSGRYDLIQVMGWSSLSFWIAMIVARMRGLPVMLGSDAVDLKIAAVGRFKAAMKRRVIPAIVRFAGGLTVASTTGLDFHRSLGIPSDRLFLLPNVVDTDLFARSAQALTQHDARSRLGLPTDRRIALFVAKLVPWKRPQDLVQALVGAPDWVAAFAGDGPQRPRLKQLAEELGVSDRCHFLGFVNQGELPAVYRAADIVVLPSEQEPFGVVVCEGFACGVPALVSDAVGVQRNGECWETNTRLRHCLMQ